MTAKWQPTASLEMLKTKARLLSKLRAFFDEKNILEVQTPILSQAGNTEPTIESFVVQQNNKKTYLNTSPEFAMKRLLAADYGSIYQITPAFRQEEQSKRHNSEFTLLEWYRIGFDHHALMHEVDELIRFVAKDYIKLAPSQHYTYQDAMIKFASIDPFNTTVSELEAATQAVGIEVVGMDDVSYDVWFDLIMSEVVEKNLPSNCPVFIYDYPSSQAALAKIRKGEQDVAERFELYINGMELANGFYELSDAAEQEQRFHKDQEQRKKNNQQSIPIDKHLIEAMKEGFPECAGVALGLERLLMVLTGTEDISDVLAFPFDRA